MATFSTQELELIDLHPERQELSGFLLVDDDVLCNTIAEWIIKANFGSVPVVSFTDGKAALEFIRSYYIADSLKDIIIFLDLNMPNISGWEFLDLLNEFPEEVKRSIKTYILSSSIDNRDKERALINENVVDFFSKPMSKEILKRIS